MTDLPDDAALVIARWCWPERFSDHPNSAFGQLEIALALECRPEDIHAAERVVIERGLAEEYGEMLGAVLDIAGQDDGSPLFMLRAAALLATAPPDARLRALYAVISAASRDPQPPRSAPPPQPSRDP